MNMGDFCNKGGDKAKVKAGNIKRVFVDALRESDGGVFLFVPRRAIRNLKNGRWKAEFHHIGSEPWQGHNLLPTLQRIQGGKEFFPRPQLTSEKLWMALLDVLAFIDGVGYFALQHGAVLEFVITMIRIGTATDIMAGTYCLGWLAAKRRVISDGDVLREAALSKNALSALVADDPVNFFRVQRFLSSLRQKTESR